MELSFPSGVLMSLVVDAYQHFWTYRTYQTSWMEAAPYAGDPAFQPLRRSFRPADLMPELKTAGVDCTATIEAADSLVEHQALLANARAHDWIRGVVGWVRSPIRARLSECWMMEPKSRPWLVFAI
jgi:predicted TIM-barrel fold metal-dependent hydrolase